MDAYTSFALVYDTFMDNIPYQEWADYIGGLLCRYGITDGLVLDLGCGTGGMTELLAARGYDMIGVDSSADMLEIAMDKRERSGHDILYLQQDMAQFELYGTVRAVASVCDCVNYITDEEELLQVFRLVNNYLDPGGVFFFDFNTEYKYREVLGEQVIAEDREKCSFIWDNYYSAEDEINEYELTLFVQSEDGSDLYRKYQETHYQRAYTLLQMIKLLESAGLEYVDAFDAYTQEKPCGHSERICVVAREHGKGRNIENMTDYIVRATAAEGQIRAFAATTRQLVETARQYHNTSPVATAALGRLLTAGGMMGSMMKNDSDMLTLKVNGDGPIGGITVTADSHADVKGYVNNPDVLLPAKNGKLDVGGAVGIGIMQVIKDMGLKEPYVGETILVTSEIAEDLTYYFANSEQVPSSVGLGVLMNKDNTVRCAGGFIIQLMPFAGEQAIGRLEENLKEITSVTALLDEGYTPEKLLERLLGSLDLEITDRMPTRFYCNCSKERVERVVASIGKKDIQEMIDEGKDIEVKCHFCNTGYHYTVEELKGILKLSKK